MGLKRLREDIACIFERDPAARNTFEVLTTYPGVHAIIHYRIANWLWRKGFKWLARLLSTFSRWMTGIEIHPGATDRKSTRLNSSHVRISYAVFCLNKNSSGVA